MTVPLPRDRVPSGVAPQALTLSSGAAKDKRERSGDGLTSAVGVGSFETFATIERRGDLMTVRFPIPLDVA